MEMNITSLEDLRRYAEGDIVRLPDFSEGRPFIARLRRPSLMKLVQHGKIPNSLLKSANNLFSTGIAGAFDEENKDSLKDLDGVMEAVCDASFVEPTYSQIKECGVELTDEQLMFIFNYSQQGVKALESFRVEHTSSENTGVVEGIQ